MAKLPFKKKTSDEEEEYENEGDEEEFEELAEINTSNEERTQFIQPADLAEDDEEDEDDEDDEESDEPQGLKDKIQWQVDQLLKKIKSLTNKKNAATADEDEDIDEDRTQAEIKKPDQKKRLIQGLIVLALVYFIAEEFLKEPEIPEAAPQLKARPDQAPEADTPIDTPLDATDTVEPVTDQAPATEETIGEGLSEAVIADQSDDTQTDTETETPSIAADDSAPVVEEPTLPEDNVSPPVDDEPIVTEDGAAPSQPDDLDQVGQGQVPNDIYGDLSSPIGESEGDLTEKILQDLETQTKDDQTEGPAEYVAPPDYEYQGRGLVYNCKALHWACVDGPSYKVCEQNASYLQKNQQAPECYPFNIYESSKGCTNMQNRMVSSGASTDFCKNF